MNDKDIISYFKRAAESVRLSFSEREDIKNHIIFSPYLFHSTFFTYKRLVSVIAVLALIVTSGGTSFAAASSLPGDPLYGVKVNVNEEVQSIIAIGPDAKVKVAADRVKERLNEADQLSAKGDLTPAKQAIIKQNLKKHTEALKANIAVLASEKENDQVEETNQVIDDLKTTLDQHEVSLEIQSAASSTPDVSASSTATTTLSKSTDKLSDIISGVVEAKAEVETLQKTLDDRHDAEDKADDNNKGGINASSTATTTISITIEGDNATTTATTTINVDIDHQPLHPSLHYKNVTTNTINLQ